MTNFRLEDHFNDAIASIEDEMNKFSRWIENNIVDKNYIQ